MTQHSTAVTNKNFQNVFLDAATLRPDYQAGSCATTLGYGYTAATSLTANAFTDKVLYINSASLPLSCPFTVPTTTCTNPVFLYSVDETSITPANSGSSVVDIDSTAQGIVFNILDKATVVGDYLVTVNAALQ